MLICTVVLKGFVCTTVMSLSLGMLCATWIALLCGSAWLMSTTCRRRAQVLKRKQLYAHLPIRLVGGKVDILKIGRQGNTTSDKEEGKGKLDHDFGGNIGESGQQGMVFAGICKYQLIPTAGGEGGQQEMVLLQLRTQSQTPTDYFGHPPTSLWSRGAQTHLLDDQTQGGKASPPPLLSKNRN